MSLINKKQKFLLKIHLKHDLPAGLTVFLVALPLCLGIALASNAPLSAGLIAGIVGGLVVSVFTGSELSVSGPAAGLTTLVAAAMAQAGSFETFLVYLFLAGLIQIGFGVFRLGNVANYFPASVINGMLAAIGLILIVKQLPIALGYGQSNFWQEEFLRPLREGQLVDELLALPPLQALVSFALTAVSLALLMLGDRRAIKKRLPVPPALIVVVVGALLNFAFMQLLHLPARAAERVKLPQNIFAELHLPHFSSALFSYTALKTAATLAVLASIETLLCIEAIDKLVTTNRSSSGNRELIAQGIGNAVCGLVGGLPITAVIVRGAANVEAGARTRIASVIHGLLMLVAVLFLVPIINYIPLCALASILLYTGYKLAHPRKWVGVARLGLNQFLPFVITIGFILTTDLLTGVIIGLLLSIYFIVRQEFHPQYKLTRRRRHETEVFEFVLHPSVSFLNRSLFKQEFARVPRYSEVVIDGTNTTYIDYDILEAIVEFKEKAHLRGIDLQLKGIELPEEVLGH
jgi:MFS superfamily sulfate permease-like transporter